MKNLIQDTLKRIKKEQISPEPKWKFLLRKISAWALIGLAILAGALAISVGYYLFSQLDFDLYQFANQNPFVYALSVMPYFWLILVGLAMVAVFLGVRRTEQGYRFNGLRISLLIVAGIFIIGFFMFRIGFGGRFNSMMMHNTYYAQNIETKEKQWMQPDRGFLAGTIYRTSENSLSLNDLNGQQWEVQLTEKTLVRPTVNIANGQMIKIIGIKQTEKNFVATEIRPWAGCGMGMGTSGAQSNSTGACGNNGGMMNRW